MNSNTRDSDAMREYDERDPIDRAIDAFHEVHPLAGNEPMDWPARFMEDVRIALKAAIAVATTATDAEPAAYLVRGIDSQNEEYASVWIKRQNADAAAAGIFRATITPLDERRAAAPQANLTDEQREAIQTAINLLPDEYPQTARNLRALLAEQSAAPKETVTQKRDDTGRLTSDYEPTPYEIKVAREAICREFGNNGTDGYYMRILKAIHGASPLPRASEQADERPDPNDIQGWAVTVNVNARDILTIGHNSLSGIDNIEDFAPVVRNCAEHLLSFIGADHQGTDGHLTRDAARYRWLRKHRLFPPTSTFLNAVELDAAIDAARKGDDHADV
ncbi:hypothetical protein [Paraburkholderia phenoliruptrix]|uniref:hypothetical protein n=2 Tax=Paraburkholderia phenoliruptrix TaxID=252970 RepID=UPI001C6EE4B5|nr:hypothetical protein [Paraburkholderia phenoliruptrix]MBW9102900.1 hypothetical protein [Paraburkholderia phenoliruptrix]MBW9132873.1 hypothetical protein [Paraburkholderia ginsengiterrae]